MIQRLLIGLAASAVVLFTSGASAAEIRLPDVLYLDEFNEPPLKLKALRRVAITFSRDPRSTIAYLAAGQTMNVIGLGDTMHYGEARTATGTARGWVRADALEAAPQEVVDRVRNAHARKVAHEELIARHEVTLGMTQAEVQASLGKPDRRKRVRSEEGDTEHWVYISYKYLPHYSYQYDAEGKFRPFVSYRRVPSGERIVTFRDGSVVEIADDVEVKPDAAPAVIAPVPGF